MENLAPSPSFITNLLCDLDQGNPSPFLLWILGKIGLDVAIYNVYPCQLPKKIVQQTAIKDRLRFLKYHGVVGRENKWTKTLSYKMSNLSAQNHVEGLVKTDRWAPGLGFLIQ